MSHPLRTATRLLQPPAILHAAVARIDGPSSELVWNGTALEYRSWRGRDACPSGPVPIIPGPDAWERFWAALDSAGCWGWDGRYDAPDHGGDAHPGWLLRIHHAGRRVEASGLAAYPDGSPGRPGPAFRRVCHELAVLAGHRPIG